MVIITFDMAISFAVSFSVISIFTAIIADFILFDKGKGVKREKRSIVATGTMTAFYILYLAVISTGVGSVVISDGWVHVALSLTGVCLVVVGAAMNIWGRVYLKGNWANHIRIYSDQTLITSGIYGVVRHPLYSSLMVMLLGGSIVYANYASAILTIVVFIPFMYYRARQEEKMLKSEFSEYGSYMKQTGMFFPKLRR